MRGEPDVAAAEFVRHRRAKHPCNELALVRVKRLARRTDHAQLRQCQRAPPRFGVGRQQGDARRVAIEASGLPRLQRIEISIHALGRHGERVQHQLVDQAVAQGLDAVGLVQLHRRAPQIGLALARFHPPPAPRAHAPCRIRGLAGAAEIKDQRLAAGAAGGVLEYPTRHAPPDQLLDVITGIALVHRRQARPGRPASRHRREPSPRAPLRAADRHARGCGRAHRPATGSGAAPDRPRSPRATTTACARVSASMAKVGRCIAASWAR